MEALRRYMAKCLFSGRFEAEEENSDALIRDLMYCSRELQKLGHEKDAEIALLAAFFCGCRPNGVQSFRGNRFILTIVSRMVKNLKISSEAFPIDEIIV